MYVQINSRCSGSVACTKELQHLLSLTLMVCVNDTATRPRLTLVKRFPSVCTPAKGEMPFACTHAQNCMCDPKIQQDASSNMRQRHHCQICYHVF